MTGAVTLRPFTLADVEDHNAGEDAESIRWLTEGHQSTVESTTRWIEKHAEARRARTGEQVFAIELDGRLSGMVAGNLSLEELEEGEANISYAVHPWARRRGVARTAVGLLCRWLADQELATTAVIRVEPDNTASIRTALSCGFVAAGQRTQDDGTVMAVLRLPLHTSTSSAGGGDRSSSAGGGDTTSSVGVEVTGSARR